MATFFRDNSIGTDPTNVPVIENLDVAPKAKNENNKKNDLVKKIIFTVVVVLLMLGVAGGLYFYLNLGQKNKTTSSFTLNDIDIPQGQVLSSNINDYGTFTGIDVSTCEIDLSGVDNLTPGSYSYSVKCFKTTKQAIIKVIAYNNFKLTTKILTRKVGSSVVATSFVEQKPDYTYSFVENDDYANLQRVGLRVVAIDVQDKDNNHQTVYGVLNVIENDYLMMMDCRKDNNVQRVVFDYNNTKMGKVIDIYEVKYENEEELLKNVININNGSITLDNHTGFALIDYSKLQIRIFSALEDSSIPNSYNEIRNYYINNSYTC